MLAIIGGTGIYQLEGLEVLEDLTVATPFGEASVNRVAYAGKEILFLPRHGKNHQFLPHEINFRANIFALKKMGAKQVVGLSATGSLRQEIAPGDFAIPEQYFDWVKGPRVKTFFGEGLAAHVSTAETTCPDLTKWIVTQADQLGQKIHTGKTYAGVDGPRLGTKAESHFLRSAGCDLVGMTNVPEAFLAREAQLCYATIGIVTDYDCWMDDSAQHVTVAQVIERYGASISKAQELIRTLLESDFPAIDEDFRQSLKFAVLTPDVAVPEEKRELLEVLRK